jgi:UDP-N-acetylmuramoyl-tripeptide--D-alanyl-D-alanine ligase
VPVFTSDQLAAWTGGRWTALPAGPLTGFSSDTRQLKAGDGFIALKSERRDGHAFLAAAQAAGASAALVARADGPVAFPQLVVADPLVAFQAVAREHRRSFRGPVIGISGSAGKTSTKDLLRLLLGGPASSVVATEDNLNNHLGVPLTLTRIDPVRHGFAVIEAGISAPGEMEPLAAMIEPDVAVTTLIAPAHTAALGGLDGVAREKALLAAATRVGGVAIFTRETAALAPFRQLVGKTLVVARTEALSTVEKSPGLVYYTLSQRPKETRLVLGYEEAAPVSFNFRRVSDGQACNAALAICASLWLGVKAVDIQERLGGWKAGKLRGEIREEAGRRLYLDCYNANPASMADALAAFTECVPAADARLYVLGGMEELGAGAEAYHRALGGSIALREADRAFVIGDHAPAVRAGLLERGGGAAQVHVVASLAPVVAAVASWRGAVFVKGSRRFQLEQILAGQVARPSLC